jgi:hypothetical protein
LYRPPSEPEASATDALPCGAPKKGKQLGAFG